MTDHYYSREPQSISNPQILSVQINSLTYTFKTDHGVFSKSGIDFGSRLLIETFEPPAISGSILDMGCGYGALGITLAKRFQNRSFTMVDVNERAVDLAKENAEKNSVNAKVFQSNLYENVTGHFAAIVTNPPIRAGKDVVHKIFEGAKAHLVNNGELWVVIQKKQGASSAVKKLSLLFNKVHVVSKKKGFQIICAIKS